MDIAFINLTHHEKSKSSAWFVDHLSKTYTVGTFSYDADNSVIHDILIAKPKLIVCWQVDFLVPWFIAHGQKAISVPMADACENMPSAYFELISLFGSISFTGLIADKISAANGATVKLEYWPKPNFDLGAKRKNFCFLGVRKTDFEFPIELIKRLRGQGKKCHIHNSIDSYLPTDHSIRFDSQYFEDKNDLNKLLLNSEYFICPRPCEGIGLSYLHALSLGCIPIGVDGPGMQDYIQHGVTGFLFNPKDKKFKTLLKDIRECDTEAIRSNIYKQLESNQSRMNDQLKNVEIYINQLINLTEEEFRPFIKRLKIGRIINPTRVLNGRYVHGVSLISAFASIIGIRQRLPRFIK
ncbi:MAG: glycosyltransferase [Oceanospirillaceae bacterium]